MTKSLISAAVGVALGLGGLLAADMAFDRTPPHTFPILERFPNVELQTHDGETVRFYDDLIQGKTVAISFMYVECKSF